MKIRETLIEDTYAELFKMWASRIIVTADNIDLVEIAANSIIGFATSIIMCPCEAGVDSILSEKETPDGRPGVSIMFFTRDKNDLNHVLLERLSQCILTAPTTSVFDGLDSEEKTNVGFKISFFGDGWQNKESKFNKQLYKLPMMDGDFYIESSFSLSEAMAGGNFLILGRDKKSTLKAAMNAVNEIKKVKFAITSFPGGICRSGSKIGSKYKGLVASINESFCPSLKNKVTNSQLSSDIECVYEIVINGLKIENIKDAMLNGIKAAAETNNITKITSANYGGKLGSDKIYLKNLFNP